MANLIPHKPVGAFPDDDEGWEAYEKQFEDDGWTDEDWEEMARRDAEYEADLERQEEAKKFERGE